MLLRLIDWRQSALAGHSAAFLTFSSSISEHSASSASPMIAKSWPRRAPLTDEEDDQFPR